MITKRATQTKDGRRHYSSTAGFTLTELMVVIAIIATLATIVGVTIFQHLADAEVTTAKAQIQNLKTALTSYRITFKKLPTEQEGGLQALIDNPKGRNFLDSTQVPLDPWGNDYIYTYIRGDEYTIVSYGADGMVGGIDHDADISSDNLAGEE